MEHKTNIKHKKADPKEQAERLNEKGKILGRARKDLEALEYFKFAAEICPDKGKYRYNMGIAYKNTKRYEEALRCLFDALELGYEHCDCYSAIGSILREKEEYELAESYVDKALELDTDNMCARIEKASLHLHKGDREKALEDVNTLISMNPDNPKFYLLRAILYYSFGMKNELKKEIKKAHEVYENIDKKLSRKQISKTFETVH